MICVMLVGVETHGGGLRGRGVATKCTQEASRATAHSKPQRNPISASDFPS